jgi:hypothetical protein
VECPHCGRKSDEVIDSRPIKEGVAIRRRRQCLACRGRFTTYESTEEQLPFVLIKKGHAQGGAMRNVRTVLAFTSRALSAVTEELGSLVERLDSLECKGKAGGGGKQRPRGSVPEKAARKTATDEVLKIIRRHKRGVNRTKLRARTGYDDSKIGNILYRARKEGKIRRVSRGTYVANR